MSRLTDFFTSIWFNFKKYSDFSTVHKCTLPNKHFAALIKCTNIHINGFLITKIAPIQHVCRAEIPLLHYFFNLSPIFVTL